MSPARFSEPISPRPVPPPLPPLAPGWDVDPLTIEEPEPPKRAGCWIFPWLVVVVLVASLVPAPSEAPENRMGEAAGLTLAGAADAAQGLRGAPASFPGSDPAGHRGDGGSIPQAVPAGAPPPGSVGTVLLGGKATWYDTPGHTAAAGPVLRDVLGDWRGRYVTVEAGDRSVTVKLTDWCACGERGGIPTLLDLSRSAFATLADPSAGVINVSIEIDGSPRPDPRDDAMRDEVRDPLPATSTLGAP